MKVNMLGVSFTLQSDEDDGYLKQVLEYFEIKLEETRRKVETADPTKLAILTGIFVVDELFKARAEQSEMPLKDMEEAEKLTLNLIDMLVHALDQ